MVMMNEVIFEVPPHDQESALAHAKGMCPYCARVKRVDGFCVRHQDMEGYVYTPGDFVNMTLNCSAEQFAAFRDRKPKPPTPDDEELYARIFRDGGIGVRRGW